MLLQVSGCTNLVTTSLNKCLDVQIQLPQAQIGVGIHKFSFRKPKKVFGYTKPVAASVAARAWGVWCFPKQNGWIPNNETQGRLYIGHFFVLCRYWDWYWYCRNALWCIEIVIGSEKISLIVLNSKRNQKSVIAHACSLMTWDPKEGVCYFMQNCQELFLLSFFSSCIFLCRPPSSLRFSWYGLSEGRWRLNTWAFYTLFFCQKLVKICKKCAKCK